MKFIRLILILLGWFFLIRYSLSSNDLTTKDLVQCIIWSTIIIENGIHYHFGNKLKEKEDENDSDN